MMHVLDAVFPGVLPEEDHRRAARAIAEIASQIEALGIDPMVTTDLDWLCRRYASRGQPMAARQCDTKYFPNASRPDRTQIIALMRNGECVGTAAARLVFVDGSLKDACESRRFFYGDRVGQADPTEVCHVTESVLTRLIVDTPVIFSCCYQVDQAEAGEDTGVLLTRLIHALALVTMQAGWIVALVKEPIARAFTHRRYGFEAVTNGIWLYRGNERPEDAYHFVPYASRQFMLRQLSNPAYVDPSASLSNHDLPRMPHMSATRIPLPA